MVKLGVKVVFFNVQKFKLPVRLTFLDFHAIYKQEVHTNTSQKDLQFHLLC